MTYNNNQLAEMYTQTYYTHRGDGTQRTAQAIRRAPIPMHAFYAQYGSLEGVSIKGMTLEVKTNIEALLYSQPHENPRR